MPTPAIARPAYPPPFFSGGAAFFALSIGTTAAVATGTAVEAGALVDGGGVEAGACVLAGAPNRSPTGSGVATAEDAGGADGSGVAVDAGSGVESALFTDAGPIELAGALIGAVEGRLDAGTTEEGGGVFETRSASSFRLGRF